MTRLDTAAAGRRAPGLDRHARRRRVVDRHDRRRRHRDAPAQPLRGREWSEFAFIVTAQKDGDVAYVGSDWNDGVMPWDFGLNIDLGEANRCCGGRCSPIAASTSSAKTCTSRRSCGATRPRASSCCPTAPAWRSPSPTAGTRGRRARRQGQRMEYRRVDVYGAARGHARQLSVKALLESDRPKPPARAARTTTTARTGAGGRRWSSGRSWWRRTAGRTSASTSRCRGDTAIAGDALNGVVTARYLFGAPMNKRPTHWTFTRTPMAGAPAAITNASRKNAGRFRLVRLGEAGTFTRWVRPTRH